MSYEKATAAIALLSLSSSLRFTRTFVEFFALSHLLFTYPYLITFISCLKLNELSPRITSMHAFDIIQIDSTLSQTQSISTRLIIRLHLPRRQYSKSKSKRAVAQEQEEEELDTGQDAFSLLRCALLSLPVTVTVVTASLVVS
jgi:hypothetical protein